MTRSLKFSLETPKSDRLLGLYFHIPFCRSKCHYCDFYSVTDWSDTTRESYLQGLIHELNHAAATGIWDRSLETIYIGGGTPTVLPVSFYTDLLKAISVHWSLDQLREFTVEANPESLNARWLQEMSQLGVNRISLGVQSLSDRLLRRLGRLHDVGQAETAMQIIRDSPIEQYSVDFIFGTPGETPEDLERELRLVERLRPPHLSWYGLTYEPGTPLYEQWQRDPTIHLPSDEEADRYLTLHHRLEALGYDHYETSNFARPGMRAIHNERYWQHEPVLGIGAAAGSWDGTFRWVNEADINAWLSRLRAGDGYPPGREEIRDDALILEILYLGLRTQEGVNPGRLRSRFPDAVIDRIVSAFGKSRYRSYFIHDQDKIGLTLNGSLLLDEIVVELAELVAKEHG